MSSICLDPCTSCVSLLKELLCDNALLHAQFNYLVCQNFILFFLLWMYGKRRNVSYGLETEVMLSKLPTHFKEKSSYVKKKVDTMLALYLSEGGVRGFC
jgi:hypothetical protein